jgi:hypothetical protein
VTSLFSNVTVIYLELKPSFRFTMSTNPGPADLHVLVIGAGITGLLLAQGLRQVF